MKFVLIIAITILILPINVLAGEMVSPKYKIIDTAAPATAGPKISAVNYSAIGSTTALISWTTDIEADSYVIYDTNNGFTNSKEQGTSKKTKNHNIELVGLEPNTIYYFKVKSSRSGNITIDSSVYSFTTVAATSQIITQQSGGGILIIDKNDKIAPEIYKLVFANITSSGATINWETNEDANSFVEYGEDQSFGMVNGNWLMKKDHTVRLYNLKADTIYYFRAVSGDQNGNLGRSEILFFKTLKEEKQDDKIKDKETKDALENIFEKITEIFKSLSPERAIIFQYDLINAISDLVPSPIVVSEPKVEVETTKAIISWTTNRAANSLVAIVPESQYRGEDSYIQVIGDSEASTLNHRVVIYDLEPDTIYHFQLRNKSGIGRLSKSRDYTFKTKAKALEINNFYVDIINNETTVFKWITTKEADSAVKIMPYKGEVVNVQEERIIKNNNYSIMHEITVNGLESGIVYYVNLISADRGGITVNQAIPNFSTSKEKVLLEITQVRTNSTILSDQNKKVQTIITWKTNKPATSQVYFNEGTWSESGNWQDKTALDGNYTKDHIVVISKFKPGQLYTFAVESVDMNGEKQISTNHVFMTPKRSQSIFEIILAILSKTFGWVNNVI